MKNTKKNAFYAQSGGVTSVINASACGVIESARKNKKFIHKLYAGKNGILGALNQELIDSGFDQYNFSVKKEGEKLYIEKD